MPEPVHSRDVNSSQHMNERSGGSYVFELKGLLSDGGRNGSYLPSGDVDHTGAYLNSDVDDHIGAYLPSGDVGVIGHDCGDAENDAPVASSPR
eukprot:8300371-Alexandrium_andersonii.AAC.1